MRRVETSQGQRAGRSTHDRERLKTLEREHKELRRANEILKTASVFFATEVTRHQGPWRNLEAVEFATLTWLDWFNNRRLFEPIGNVPPCEKEIEYYRTLQRSVLAACLKPMSLRKTPGSSSHGFKNG